jgi:conjugal transfer pilus assembly protein TraV
MSVSGVYETSRHNALPAQMPAAPATPGSAPPAAVPPAAPSPNPSSASGPRRAPLTSGTPLRSAPRILRIWIAPYEDSEGDLRDQSHIYVTVDRGRWQIEHTRRAIQERFAPIRAVSPSSGPPAASTGPARGADATGLTPPPLRSSELAPIPGTPGGGGTPVGGR